MAALVEPMSQLRDRGIMVPLKVEEGLSMLPGIQLPMLDEDPEYQPGDMQLAEHGLGREQPQQQGSCLQSVTISDDEATMDEAQDLGSTEGGEDVEFEPRPKKKQKSHQHKGHRGGKDAGRACRNHTGYIGVRRRQWGMFAAEIRDGDKRRWLGSFNQAGEAGMAYDAALILQKKHRAKTNFVYTDFATMPRPGAEHGGCVRYSLVPKEVLELYKTQYHEVMSIMGNSAGRNEQRSTRARQAEERAGTTTGAAAALNSNHDSPVPGQQLPSRTTRGSHHAGTGQPTATAGGQQQQHQQQPTQGRSNTATTTTTTTTAQAQDSAGAMLLALAASTPIKREDEDGEDMQPLRGFPRAAGNASPAHHVSPAAGGDRGVMATLKPLRVPANGMTSHDTAARAVNAANGPASHAAMRHATVPGADGSGLTMPHASGRPGVNGAMPGSSNGSPASASRGAAVRTGSRMRQVGYFEHEATGPTDPGTAIHGMDIAGSTGQMAMYIPAGPLGYMGPVAYSMAPVPGVGLSELPQSLGQSLGHSLGNADDDDDGDGDGQGRAPGYQVLGAPYSMPGPGYSMLNMGPHGMIAMPFGPGMHPMGYPYGFPVYAETGQEQSGDESGETETDDGSGDEDGKADGEGMPGGMPAMYMYGAPSYGMHPGCAWGSLPPHMQGPPHTHSPGMPAVMGHLPKPTGIVMAMDAGERGGRVGREGTGASPRSARNPVGTCAGRATDAAQGSGPAVWNMCTSGSHLGAPHVPAPTQAHAGGRAGRVQLQNGSEESEQHSHVPLGATASSQLNPAAQEGVNGMHDSPACIRKAPSGSIAGKQQAQVLKTLDLSTGSGGGAVTASQDMHDYETSVVPQTHPPAGSQPFCGHATAAPSIAGPPAAMHMYSMQQQQPYPLELEHPIKIEMPAYEQMPLHGYPTVYGAPPPFVLSHMGHQMPGWPQDAPVVGQVPSPRRGPHGAKTSTAMPQHYKMMQAQ